MREKARVPRDILAEKRGDLYVVQLKKLAGDSTRTRPIEWMFREGEPVLDPTPHGNIILGIGAKLFDPDNGPSIELGGDIKKPVLRPNANVLFGPGVDIVCDLNDIFPMDSDTYSMVYSSFLMEHIKNSRLRQFISECYRITKPGGVNIHVMPNLRAQCESLANIDHWDYHIINTIFAGEETPDREDHWSGYHKTGMSPELAVELFKEAGFSEVVVWEYPKFHLEMVIEAWK